MGVWPLLSWSREYDNADPTILSSSRINNSDNAPKTSHGHRWPPSELNGWPTFKLEPNLTPHGEERSIIAAYTQFNGAVCCFGNDQRKLLPGFYHHPTLGGKNTLNNSIPRSDDRLRGLTSEAGFNTSQIARCCRHL
jgi:hypothetical protein